MMRRVCSFDASILRINDDSPIKVTFLNANGNGHFVGFYSISDGVFYDIRTLFANAGADVLIPKVSSVFLGNRLNGRTPVFFVIENGYALNKDFEWFQDAAAGHGGFLKFLKPPSQPEMRPVLNQGKLIWQKEDSSVFEEALPADSGTSKPVLIWQSNSGRVFSVKGKIFHSFGNAHASDLGSDRPHRFSVAPQEDGSSVILDFIDVLTQKSELSLNLHIGERNLAALTRNRVIGAVSDWPQIQMPILSATVEIPDEFEDTLYLEGFENQKTIPIAGVTFLVEGSDTNRLILTGDASVEIYKELLSCVKIRTAASASAQSDVRIIFNTSKEEIVVVGKTNILSEKAQASSLLAGLSLAKTVSEGNNAFSTGFFSDIASPHYENKNQPDDLPSFLTQPVSTPAVVKTQTNGKTVLITGGACKRGNAIAHAFASRGYNVIVHCHTSAAQAVHLTEEIQQKYHVKTAYFRADFNSYEETADLIPSVTKTYGSIDVLVCHAFTFAKDEAAEGWDCNMAVNFRAPFVLMRSFAASLPKGREGAIVSVFPESPNELSAYALTCSSLPGLIASAAGVYRNKIKIAGLAVVDSPSDDSQIRKIAETVCFLAENQVVSGQTLKLDVSGAAEKKASLF
ncbi:MAG: SDR family NAD(P)-dependent oxidoreductase [Alphaproteobacteria bacterium]|nr:SDR family NAD(P)-dependent oxidoreductase [Alphaproteobacteria bacterium]